MPRKKILLSVTTYPLPSRNYDELVCTAGFLEDGSWIRLYPVPLSFLSGLKRSGIVQQTKYTWIELDVEKRTDDFRPESHSPSDYEFKDLVVGEHLDTARNWEARKATCLRKVYTNLDQLLENSKAPVNTSLATFKPARITSFEVEEDTTDWKPVWQALQQQLSLFSATPDEPRKAFPKVPYKFYYRFEDDAGRSSRLMIEDWEIGALYGNCLRDSQGDAKVAVEKVRQKYEADFQANKDIYLFLGTTKEWHFRRARNPFCNYWGVLSEKGNPIVIVLKRLRHLKPTQYDSHQYSTSRQKVRPRLFHPRTNGVAWMDARRPEPSHWLVGRISPGYTTG